jgi:hypothetical protein
MKLSKQDAQEFIIILSYLWPEALLILVAILLGVIGRGELGTILEMTIIVTAQNGTFVLSSRARQSKNLLYHAATSMVANLLFIIIITASPVRYNTPLFIVWYAICATVAAVHAQYIAIQIEKDPWLVSTTSNSGSEDNEKKGETRLAERITNERNRSPSTVAKIRTPTRLPSLTASSFRDPKTEAKMTA